jgi:ABC-type transport system involved in cytochrome c biogenesis ATPase subunit
VVQLTARYLETVADTDTSIELGAAGDPDKFAFAVTGIQIGDDDMFPLGGPGSVTAVVGGNNAGKSTLLSQIRDFLAFQGSHLQPTPNPQTPHVVTAIKTEWSGTRDDMEAWIRGSATIIGDPPNEMAQAPSIGSQSLHELLERHGQPFPGHRWNWFVNHQPASGRVGVVETAERLYSIGDPPNHPLHMMYKSAEISEEVRKLAKRIFDIDLYLEGARSQFNLRLGHPTVAEPLITAVTKEYVDDVEALPLLSGQGDGIRSALGMLIPLITNTFPLALIDEPEAFLHPPQARIAGRAIGENATKTKTQVILATHDKNILRGLVESNVKLTIVHLRRDPGDDHASAKVLGPEDISDLWKDVTLRYSNVIEGLFHSAVIVTENDRDSHFYEAAIDATSESLSSTDPPPSHNLMFVGADGKTNISKIVLRLEKLGVRAVSTPDLDILDSEKVMEKLVEAHGGTWAELESTYKKAVAQFLPKPNAPKLADVRATIDEILATTEHDKLNEDMARRIKNAVTLPSDSWNKLKEAGTYAFTAELVAATTLLEELDRLGIVTVKVGVLEKFLTTTTAPKGPEWLPVALEAGAHKTGPAQAHVKRLLIAAAGFVPAAPEQSTVTTGPARGA